ncbi:hypothetical protein SAMN05421739_1187 [Pontibacter chinhatensis]|uniref:Uncharacterized protein n=2 Tax=Pontibacter chinhatensis TaxID=1436961 RepID=A0A1I2ZTQ1_9BACT|nr:hypothetical protein SAMN05421739_1187 [Pontibacter chinhatensis]
MTHVLENEVLYRSDDGGTIIYKTYSKELKLYGLLWEAKGKSRFADTTYRHIFPYQEERAAAITDKGKFVWIDTGLQESDMEELDRVLFECESVKSASCSCLGKLSEFDCELCGGSGEIFNELNWRRLDSRGNRMFFEYDNGYDTYSIIVTPSAEFSNINANDVWEEAELESNIRLFIDNHKEQLLGLPLFLHVFITGRDSRLAGVRLIPCSISIELINNLPPDESQQNSFFFDYSTFLKRKS